MTKTNGKSSEAYILFQLAGAIYGIPSSQVLQLQMIEQITPVPQAPAYVDGVAFHRGRVIPAVNLRARFGFSRIEYDESARLIVTQSQERVVGLIVDSAREFVNLPLDSIQQPPDVSSKEGVQYLRGVAVFQDRLILLVDLTPILDAGVEVKMDKELLAAALSPTINQ